MADPRLPTRKFKHFVLFSALSGVGMLLELAVDLMDPTC